MKTLDPQQRVNYYKQNLVPVVIITISFLAAIFSMYYFNI